MVHLHLLALLVFYISPFLLHGLVEDLQSMAVISFLAFSIMILLDRGSTWAVPYGSMVQHAIGKVGQRYITQPWGVLGPSAMRCFIQQIVGAYCFGFSLDGVHEKTILYHYGVHGYTFIYMGEKHKSVNKGLGTA